jgi:hypothetical protein
LNFLVFIVSFFVPTLVGSGFVAEAFAATIVRLVERPVDVSGAIFVTVSPTLRGLCGFHAWGWDCSNRTIAALFVKGRWMEMHEALVFFSSHLLDIAFAALFAAIFAAVFDLVSPDSQIRKCSRYIRNKWSERSAKDLRKRIGQLEWYRNNLATDKGLYLITLRFLLLLLTMVSAGLFVMASRELPGRLHVEIQGAFAGIQGARYASLDTREKVVKMIESVDKDIAYLKAKLPKT